MELIEKGKLVKQAAYDLVSVSTTNKNNALHEIAKQLLLNKEVILEANKKDIEFAVSNNKSESFIDRLTLNEQRLLDIIDGVKQVIHLEDPTNKTLQQWDKGELTFTKVSVPIGAIGIIYEARPNVSVDAACLCLKSGNSCFLRGSKDTIHSNIALVNSMKQALINANMNPNSIELLHDTSREAVLDFMKLNDYLDLLIPRGSANLITHCVNNASVPIIETGSGNCHVYVDSEANIQKAIDIIVNAKTQRVSVCNACESVLIHKDIIPAFLPLLVSALKQHNVIIHACEECLSIDNTLILANNDDYACEYLDYEISIKCVENIMEAINHINKYHTMHSDVIVTENETNTNLFTLKVDSACVYVNASSRFSDGNEFGFGAEIGISTQKIHARGPMGLNELTSYKYIIKGDGTIRK